MTVTTAIGQLESVPVRDVWPDEARNLTPWLADNIEVLADVLGLNDPEVDVHMRGRWSDLRSWALEGLAPLRAAMQAHIEKLP